MRGRTARALHAAALLLAVLAAHALLLHSLKPAERALAPRKMDGMHEPAWRERLSPPPMDLRFVHAAPTKDAPVAAAPGAQAMRHPRPARHAPARAPAAKAPAEPEAAAGAVVSSSGDAPSAIDAERLSSEAPNHPPIMPREALRAVPVYATRLPPSRTLHFRVTRGAAEGEGTLRWKLQDHGYEAGLTAQGEGLPHHDWTSTGATHEAGVAPTRMETRRKGRASSAANFDDALGRVTFSGPRHEQPLARGGQDRLSWVVQLAAIVHAQPERFASGQRIVLQVVGPRGDAALWNFDVVGHVPVAIDHGHRIDALLLRRDGDRLYDLDVRIWLDPTDHHLPLAWWWQQRGVRQAPTTWQRLHVQIPLSGHPS